MKQSALLLFLLFTAISHATPLTAQDSWPIGKEKPEIIAKQPTYTYVRCWYRVNDTHDDSSTSWEWALDQNGSYYRLPGYWYSKIGFKNMFYTPIKQSSIMDVCKKTLNKNYPNADISFYAADHRFSYNQAIWSNDPKVQPEVINKIVAIGDSLSDTGNIHNASNWTFPSSSWYLGRFSNGPVWTEYLAKAKKVPLYNWAVGGAAGQKQYGILPGILDQIKSYLSYIEEAKNYRPQNTLFTFEFGLNDFMNYDRSLNEVKSDFKDALARLFNDAHAKNILLFTLPDATRAPQFKNTTQVEIDKIRSNIEEFNQYIHEQAEYYQQRGFNVALYDAYNAFQMILSHSSDQKFSNTVDACLDIKSTNFKDYLSHHPLTEKCQSVGSDQYVFWGVTHPTTAVHHYMAKQILKNSLSIFQFETNH